MPVLYAEDAGDLPCPAEIARGRMPAAMEALGFRQGEGDLWQRRREHRGWAAWSLPDACPADVTVGIEDGDGGGAGASRYRITYRVRMPGQILANTDARALELEVDRLRALLCGDAPPDRQRERGRLVRLTVAANLALSLLPAASLLIAESLAWKSLAAAPLIRGLVGVPAVGLAAWGAALWITARAVVASLNAVTPTRLTYRAVPAREVRRESRAASYPPPGGDSAVGHQ